MKLFLVNNFINYNVKGYGVVADLEAQTYRITKNLDKWTKL